MVDDDVKDPKDSKTKEADKRDSNQKEPKLADTLKKVFTAGIGAAFMTEESIRNYLSELKLPKEILNTIISSAGRSKDEIVNRVTQEMLGIVRKMDFAKEFAQFAEEHKFKISAEIEIVKKPKDPIE